jgi:N-methylhydantoinase A
VRFEVVSWRVAGWAPPPADEVAALPAATGTPTRHATRRARFDRGSDAVDVPVFRRDDLGVGATVSGPAIVEERETTSVIRPGWTMQVAADGSLIATRSAA